MLIWRSRSVKFQIELWSMQPIESQISRVLMSKLISKSREKGQFLVYILLNIP